MQKEHIKVYVRIKPTKNEPKKTKEMVEVEGNSIVINFKDISKVSLK